MVLKRYSVLSLAVCLLGMPLALARRPDKPIRAEIRFLADSTIVRSGYGENDDVYLVELTADHDGSEAVLVRLIDCYPPSWTPAFSEVLALEQFHVSGSRFRQCDGCCVRGGAQP